MVTINFRETVDKQPLPHCIHINKWGSLSDSTYSREFHDYLEELDNRILIYGAYLCNKCGLPSEEHVIYCWAGDHYCYGTYKTEFCTGCKEYA